MSKCSTHEYRWRICIWGKQTKALQYLFYSNKVWPFPLIYVINYIHHLSFIWERCTKTKEIRDMEKDLKKNNLCVRRKKRENILSKYQYYTFFLTSKETYKLNFKSNATIYLNKRLHRAKSCARLTWSLETFSTWHHWSLRVMFFRITYRLVNWDILSLFETRGLSKKNWICFDLNLSVSKCCSPYNSAVN